MEGVGGAFRLADFDRLRPFLLYLTASPQEEPTDHIDRMAHAWQDLVERLCRT
ncbi:hypothetical protein AB0D54_26290 [Streptomyces xanthophaeus]|uniref:hypothetical protein n=1 Tax=Streptomyces xanthophaeus TaxID=67385 RepID=UPI003426E886